MAMVKLYPPIIEINGKIGGDVWRWDQCRQHVQAYPRIIRSPSDKQLEIRAAFSESKGWWKNFITEFDKTCWWVYSQTTKVPNKKGEMIFISSYCMFMRHNIPRSLNGEPILTKPPGWNP